MKKLALTLLAAACLATAAPDPNFHIYIAFGQSNMAGTAEADVFDMVEHPRFKIFASQQCIAKGRDIVGAIYPATPSLFNCGNTISVAHWFGRALADSLPDVTVAVIPVAVGGSSIRLFDKDLYASYILTADSWVDTYAKEYESSGNLFKVIVDIAKKAQKVGVIKGIIFHQGENDFAYADWPIVVKKTHDDILQALHLSADTVPFVAGELLRDGCCYSDRVANLSKIIDNAHYVSSEGLEGNGIDPFHFSHDAYVTYGKRYALKMLEVMNRTPANSIQQGAWEDGADIAGESVVIPGKIEAENYDNFEIVKGVSAYKMAEPDSMGGECRKDGIYIEKGGDNFAVSYTKSGEWLEYTVNALFSGEFEVSANVASGSDNSSFELYVDGEQVGSTVNVSEMSGDGRDFSTVDVGSVELESGKHVVKLAITGDDVNVDWISFESVYKAISATSDIANRRVAAPVDSSASQIFRVFNMKGKALGTIEATYGGIEAGLNAAGYERGTYLLQSPNGTKRVVQFVKP